MRRLALLLMSLLLVAPSSFHRLFDGDAKVATAATGSAQLGTDTGAWRHLRSSLLTEASARQEARTVANGKFPLSTGAWYMTDTYAKQASGITVLANGTRVCAAGASCGYRLDEKLVPCLGAHFGRRTVTELGAGVGRYQQALLSLGQVPAYTAYDGMPDVQTLTSGRVGWADLSVVQGTRILRSDYALSLEVAEHIPPQHEAM